MGKKHDFLIDRLADAMANELPEPKALAGVIGVRPTKFNQSVLPALRKAAAIAHAYPRQFHWILEVYGHAS